MMNVVKPPRTHFSTGLSTTTTTTTPSSSIKEDFFKQLNLQSANLSEKYGNYRHGIVTSSIRKSMKRVKVGQSSISGYLGKQERSVTKWENDENEPLTRILKPLHTSNNQKSIKSNYVIKRTYYVENSSSKNEIGEKTQKKDGKSFDSKNYTVKYLIQRTRKDCFNSYKNTNSEIAPYLQKEELESKVIQNSKIVKKSSTGPDFLFCPLCSSTKLFKSLYLLQKHVSSCNNCDICKMSFNGNNSLRRHMEESHKSTNYRCFECDQFFKTKAHLQVHWRSDHVHHTHNNLRCDICFKDFAVRKNLIRHIKTQHSTEIHRIDLNKFVSLKNRTSH